MGNGRSALLRWTRQRRCAADLRRPALPCRIRCPHSARRGRPVRSWPASRGSGCPRFARQQAAPPESRYCRGDIPSPFSGGSRPPDGTRSPRIWRKRQAAPASRRCHIRRFPGCPAPGGCGPYCHRCFGAQRQDFPHKAARASDENIHQQFPPKSFSFCSSRFMPSRSSRSVLCEVYGSIWDSSAFPLEK